MNERLLNSEAKRSSNNVPCVGKCPVLSVLHYIGVKSPLLENNIQDITEKSLFLCKSRIIFKSNPGLTPKGKIKYPKITIVMLYTRTDAAVRVAITVRPRGISKQGLMYTFEDV